MFHQTHIIWIVTQGPMAHVFFCFCDDLSRFSDVQSQPSWDIQSTNDICSHIHLLQRANQESRKKQKTAESSDELLVALRQNFELSNQIPINNLLEFMEKSEQSSCFIIDTTQSIWNTKLLAVLTLAETPTLKNWNF